MRVLIAAAAMITGTPVTAAVVSAAEHGFEINHSAIVPLPPDEAMRAFVGVSGWWDSEHTYSGSASNMSIALEPGGCFCEGLPNGGGIEHMRVNYVAPGKRLVLTGSLGPLLYEATTGVMDVQFSPIGSGSRVSLSYKVAGFANGGAAKLAPLVDRVIGVQVERYVRSTRPNADAP